MSRERDIRLGKAPPLKQGLKCLVSTTEAQVSQARSVAGLQTMNDTYIFGRGDTTGIILIEFPLMERGDSPICLSDRGGEAAVVVVRDVAARQLE